MLFIILFIIGALAVPLAADISRHGSNNIIRRSGEDILEFSWIKGILGLFHVTIERVNTAVLGLVSSAVLLVVAYFLLRLLELAHLFF